MWSSCRMNDIIRERYNEGQRYLLNEDICFVCMSLEDELSEALLWSYNLNKIEKELKRRFPEIISVELHRNSPYAEYAEVDVTEGEFVGSFELKLSSLKNIYKIKRDIDAYYAWHVSLLRVNGTNLFDFGNGFVLQDEGREGITLNQFLMMQPKDKKEYSLFVEANYSIKTTEIGEAYHITNTNVIHKIKRNGLNPRSKGNFPERVYFGTDVNHILWMVGRSGSDLETGYIPDKTLLKLNVAQYKDEILSKYTFYKDPRDKTSVYTYDVIDPKYLMICTDNINKYTAQDSELDKDVIESFRFVPLI